MVLPPRVTSAVVPKYWCADPSLLLRSLPRSLTHLDLRRGIYHDDSSVLDVLKTAGESLDLRHLVSLSLADLSSLNTIDLWSSLSILRIDAKPRVVFTQVPKLPPQLNYFATNVASFGSDLFLSSLPRSLITCSLICGTVQGADIENLPPRLRHFSVNRLNDMSTVHLRGLPKSLVRFLCSNVRLVGADPSTEFEDYGFDIDFEPLIANRHRLPDHPMMSSEIERWRDSLQRAADRKA